MTDVRNVRVRLSAETSGYIRDVKGAGDETVKQSGRIRKAFGDTEQNLERMEGAGRKAMLGGGLALAAITKTTATFEKRMSSVDAAANTTEANLGKLRDTAIQAGADTAFSATEAAAGVENLLKAGVSVQDVLNGGLTGALDLAAAGELGVADAAEIAASALTQFRLKGEDVPHVADLLAAAAGKAQGEVSDYAQALNQAGLISSQTGLSIEETAGALALFGSAGLLGSDAGTSFKTMLMSLNPRSKEAAELMEKYNLQAYDAEGNFIGLAEYAGKLRDGLKGLTDEQRNAALQTLFGTDAIRAANLLYRNGQDGVRRWTKNVDDSGFAAEQAGKKMDNLAGDWEEFTGSLETALIGSGEGAQGPLRDLLQDATGLVNKFNELPDAIQGGAFKAAALTTALGGSLIVAGKIVRAIRSIRGPRLGAGAAGAAAQATGVVPVFVTNPGFGGAAGAPGGPTGAGGAGERSRAARIARGAGRAAGAGVAIASGTGMLGDSRGAQAAGIAGGVSLFAGNGAAAAAGTGYLAGMQLKDTIANARAARDEGDRLSATVAGVKRQILDSNLGKYAKDLGIDVDVLASNMAAYGSRGAYVQRIQKRLTEDTEGFGNAMQRTGETMLFGLVDGAHQSAYALDDLQKFTAQADDQVRNYGRSLNDLPDAVRTAISSPGAVKSWGDIAQLAREYRLTPRQVQTLVRESGARPSAARVAALNDQIARLRDRDVRITTTYLDIRKSMVIASGAGVNAPVAREDGGTVPGQRLPYGDKTLLFAAPGEEVITNRNGEADRFRADRAAGRIPAYANGGTVGGRGTTRQRLESAHLQRTVAPRGARGGGFPSTLRLVGTVQTPFGPSDINAIAHTAAKTEIATWAADEADMAGAYERAGR